MDRYITIQYKTVTTDTYGASIETWATRASYWAERVELNATERMTALQVQSNISSRYYIRYNTTVLVKDRVVDGSTTLEIVGVKEIGRKKGIELVCATI